MADVQTHFLKFHKKIKLDNFNENKTLRDKRDVLLADLKKNIAESAPTYSNFDQGSYAIYTGINPKDGNFDIDVGIIFECTRDDYDDPVELKKIVRDALDRHNRTVTIRRPCVTVEYLKNGEVDYHVDLAIYVQREEDNNLEITKGKEFSDDEQRFYEIADPKGLINEINNRFSESDEKAQMRRCIRYLKKWRDNKLPSGKPVSISLTCSCYNWFESTYTNVFKTKFDDCKALEKVVQAMLDHFIDDKLKVFLPVEPYADLNEEMTASQFDTFKEKLESLRDALQDAEREELEEEACRILRKQFGSDFLIPEKKETAKAVATAGFAPAGGSA